MQKDRCPRSPILKRLVQRGHVDQATGELSPAGLEILRFYEAGQ